MKNMWRRWILVLDDSVIIITEILNDTVSNLKVTHVYSKTAVLAWTASSNKEIVGYRVIRDGKIVGDVTECTYTDRGLTVDTGYSYAVYGYTANGKITKSTNVSVTTSSPKIQSIKDG